MPLIQITAPQGALETSARNALVSRVGNAVLRSEGASPSDPAAQALVWSQYRELSDGALYVGGDNSAPQPLQIAVTTPAGALDAQARAALVREIGEIVDDLIGPFEGRLNHWAMLFEVAEGSWAGGGQVFPLAGIQAAMNIDPIGV